MPTATVSRRNILQVVAVCIVPTAGCLSAPSLKADSPDTQPPTGTNAAPDDIGIGLERVDELPTITKTPDDETGTPTVLTPGTVDFTALPDGEQEIIRRAIANDGTYVSCEFGALPWASLVDRFESAPPDWLPNYLRYENSTYAVSIRKQDSYTVWPVENSHVREIPAGNCE